ncbi:ATP-dependent helicase, partial [Staphylococcus pseudintermedius]
HVFNWELRGGSEEKIYELIEDVCLSMKASDYLDMPERIDTVHSVNLSSKERKLYDELEKHYILESEEDGTIVAQSGASLSQKLLQLSNGAVYTDDESVRHLHDRKLDKLEEIIEESQGQPLLVFYNFKHDKERIMERFDEVVTLDDESYKDRWVEGKVKILLAHPASAGHGLNLQKGGHIIVWFGLTWSLELYQQANARLYRQGQTHTTIIHHIMTDNTIDQKVYQALQNKELTQEDLMQAIKARIKQYE